MTRPSLVFALIAVGSATCALAQTPPNDPTAPSAASSPHQRDTTESTNAAEATPTPGAGPSSAATPHQREVTQNGKPQSVTPQSFASQAAVISKAEIELGQIALGNTQDEAVRQYAERMVKDHGAADRELRAIAAKENLQIPQSLDPEHEALKKKLQGLQGEDFDRAYANAMTKGHDKAVALFESASQQTQMPSELRQFAASTLPTLEQHREMAHSLREK